MTSEASISATVARIDAAIRRHKWMDFEIWDLGVDALIVVGSVSRSPPFELEIRFERVSVVAAPMKWCTDTTKRVFGLLEEADACAFNLEYGVEQGNYLFRFQPEDRAEKSGCVIAARNVEFNEGPANRWYRVGGQHAPDPGDIVITPKLAP
jgi:hypothetical protein